MSVYIYVHDKKMRSLIWINQEFNVIYSIYNIYTYTMLNTVKDQPFLLKNNTHVTFILS